MDSVGSILPKVLKKRGFFSDVIASLVAARSAEWLQNTLPAHKDAIQVRGLVRGKVELTAANSVALMAVNGHKEAFLTYLHNTLPEAEIIDIKITRR